MRDINALVSVDEQWALVARVQAGGPDAQAAYADLYRLYRPWILGVLTRRHVGHPEVVDDLTADTFVSGWRAIARLRRPSPTSTVSPAAWFVTIAKNKSIDHHKAKARTETPFDFSSYAWARDEDRGPAAPTARCENTVDARQILGPALRTLNPEQQESVVRRHILGQSYREITEIMGFPSESATKAMIVRAVNNLRRTVTAGARELLAA